MTKEQVTKKLKALKALAEQGVGGEKEDARRLYDKAATMLKAEKQECDDCPARYGQKECEECGTYANIQRLCLQLETLSRKQKGRGQQA